MEIITSKATVNKLIADAVQSHSIGLSYFVDVVQAIILQKKKCFLLSKRR